MMRGVTPFELLKLPLFRNSFAVLRVSYWPLGLNLSPRLHEFRSGTTRHPKMENPLLASKL